MWGGMRTHRGRSEPDLSGDIVTSWIGTGTQPKILKRRRPLNGMILQGNGQVCGAAVGDDGFSFHLCGVFS